MFRWKPYSVKGKPYAEGAVVHRCGKFELVRQSSREGRWSSKNY